MFELILKEVEKKHNESAGHCGISPVQLMKNLNVDYSEIKEPLNKLHADGLVKVRNGINSFLLFKV